MGGDVPKAHGVGITSNLKMKKGGLIPGKVGEPILKKMGPDGKEREMQNPLAYFFGPAGMALLRSGASLATRGLGSIAPKFLSNFGKSGPGVRSFIRGARGEPKVTTGLRGEVTRRSGDILGSPSRGMRIAQISAAPAGLGITAAGALSAALPDISEKTQQRVPLANLAQGVRDVLLEPTASLSPLGALTFGLTGKGIAGNVESLVGKDKKIGPKSVPQSEAGETQRKQEDEFAGLQDKAERMAAAITRENNLATLSRAASDFGASALAGDDLATALRTGSQPIFDEVGRRRDLQENIGGILAQQVLADEATQGAMIAEAAKTGDPQAVIRMQKYFDAYNEGVTNILPIDAKGKIDYANMAPGTVYMDLEGVSGARYVASNSGGDDTKSFDSIEDANAFAQS